MAAPSHGKTFGPYELIEPIGKGGMGEVWRARDPRLGRDVAIKISAQQFSDRFEREARSIAALNHPNICTLHDVGPNYLVMELVEGPTLAERISEGPVPPEEALRISKQIADALEAAHEKGIIHRDLKPANIKLKPDGSVKVLDFGLAKSSLESNLTADSPTMLSAVGMIVGTAGYMAPEQARGKSVDKRADIWAFGVILYEMLTARRLFEGEDLVQTLAAAVHKEPDLSAAPARFRRALERCLVKDPNKRLRDISGIELLLEQPDPVQNPSASNRTSAILWSVAALGFLAAAILAFVHFRETPAAVQTVHATISLPPESNVQTFALSPDGRTLAMVASVKNARRQLWLRPMNAADGQPLPSTEGASYPFWSPDGRYIAFFTDNKLRKIAIAGGPPLTICDAPNTRGGAWGQGDIIIFASDVSMRRVPAGGGTPVDLKTGFGARHPSFLPDGRHFLYLVRNSTAERNGIHAGLLDRAEDKRILPDISGAVFVPGPGGTDRGNILFVRDASLMALPFDARKANTIGEAFPVVDGVATTFNFTWLPVAVSRNGLLVYSGSSPHAGNRLDWVDRTGKLLGSIGLSGRVLDPGLSRDGRFLAFRRDAGSTEIWIRDLVRGTDTRFTNGGPFNGLPSWSPAGDRIVFVAANPDGVPNIRLKSTDSAGAEDTSLTSPYRQLPTQWSSDGRFIVYSEFNPKTRADLWILPVGGPPADRKPFLFLGTEFNEVEGQLSPDGRWMAFSSDRSGDFQVYIVRFRKGWIPRKRRASGLSPSPAVVSRDGARMAKNSCFSARICG